MTWVRHAVTFLAGGGLLVAIGYGLLGAGGLRADVDTLKAEAPVARQVAADVAGIHASIAAIQREQKQQREDAQERARRVDEATAARALAVDAKFEKILDRLPRP